MRNTKVSPFGMLICPECEARFVWERDFCGDVVQCNACGCLSLFTVDNRQKVRYYRNAFKQMFIGDIMSRDIVTKSANGNEPKIVKAPSILAPELCGAIFVSGLKGIGKSYFAAQAENPKNVLFLDFEEKGRALHEKLGFGKYVCVTSAAAAKFTATFKPIQLFEVLRQTFADIEPDRYNVAILDNIVPIETALHAHVMQNPSVWGVNAHKADTQSWPAVNHLIGGFLDSLHGKGIRLVIATTHCKPEWGMVGGKFTILEGKYRPKGIEVWQERSILSVILIPGENTPTPAALVLKEQLGEIKFDDTTGTFAAYRRLPKRLPHATFAAIKGYLENPANLNFPAPGEVPTEEELEPYIGRKFRDSQLMLLDKNVQDGIE